MRDGHEALRFYYEMLKTKRFVIFSPLLRCRTSKRCRASVDPLIRYHLLKFCMNTRLSFPGLSRNVTPDFGQSTKTTWHGVFAFCKDPALLTSSDSDTPCCSGRKRRRGGGAAIPALRTHRGLLNYFLDLFHRSPRTDFPTPFRNLSSFPLLSHTIMASYILHCDVINRSTHVSKSFRSEYCFTLALSCNLVVKWDGDSLLDHLQTTTPALLVHGR